VSKDPLPAVQRTAINNRLTPIQSELPQIDGLPLPERVFHYTDIAGLLGILQSGRLWATNYQYLNDASEVRYAYLLAREVSADVAKNRAALSGRAELFYSQAAAIAPGLYKETYWLCCFSAAENSLSQWRAYGGKQGFALEFPGDVTTVPADISGQGTTPGISLLNVVYDPQVQREYLSTLTDRIVDLLMDDDLFEGLDLDLAVRAVLPFYRGQIERASYRFKHPDFSAEEEWRLVSWNSSLVKLFRPGLTLIPYTVFELYSVAYRAHTIGDRRLPLSSVRYGPTSLVSETEWALDEALDSFGYPATCCRRLGSDTPARL
jgi:hypothetical protein